MIHIILKKMLLTRQTEQIVAHCLVLSCITAVAAWHVSQRSSTRPNTAASLFVSTADTLRSLIWKKTNHTEDYKNMISEPFNKNKSQVGKDVSLSISTETESCTFLVFERDNMCNI